MRSCSKTPLLRAVALFLVAVSVLSFASFALVSAAENEKDDKADVTGSATQATATPSPSLTPEPTSTPYPTPENSLTPYPTQGPTSTPAPTAAPVATASGWPAANWVVVGIYGLILVGSVPLLFRKKA